MNESNIKLSNKSIIIQMYLIEMGALRLIQYAYSMMVTPLKA